MSKTPVLFVFGALFTFATAFASAATAPPPVVSNSTKVTIKAPLNPSAPRLSVQNIAVYLNCDQKLATKAIQQINWSLLRALLAH